MYVPMHTTEIMADEIHNHEILGLLLWRFELCFCHGASRGRSLLDSAFDGSELASAFSGPREETLWTAADYLDVLGRIGA